MNNTKLRCEHANYDDYFDVCEDCKKEGEAIMKEHMLVNNDCINCGMLEVKGDGSKCPTIEGKTMRKEEVAETYINGNISDAKKACDKMSKAEFVDLLDMLKGYYGLDVHGINLAVKRLA